MEAILQYISSEDSNSPESMKKKSDNHLSGLLNYLDELLDTGLGYDFKIICTMNGETKEIKVHKLILSRIEWFKNLFNSGAFKENRENQITIPNFEHEKYKEMIRYVYSTNVRKFGELANKLLGAANQYCIDQLKTKCEHHLIRQISEGNAASMLMLAQTHEAKKLEDATLKFIDTKFPDDLTTHKIISKRLIRTLNVENATDTLIFAYTNKWDDLKKAAMKYIQKHLMEVKCSKGWIESFPKYLIDIIDVENAAELFIFGENNAIESLKAKASAFIQDHADVVGKTDGYRKLDGEQLNEILRLSSPSKRQKLSNEK